MATKAQGNDRRERCAEHMSLTEIVCDTEGGRKEKPQFRRI
jgi:hypothetical protein